MPLVFSTSCMMAADTVESLTEPFVRDVGRVAGSGGHGLGLVLVDSVVRAHGGSLTLSGSKEGGLLVDLSLPVERDRPVSRQTAA